MRKICAIALIMSIIGSAGASDSRIVASINPIHSLVSSVMEGIGTPELLLEGTYSVHGYQIKPSDVKLLENTDVMFWIGPTMESTLTSFISSMQEDTVVIEVGEMHGLLLYETRESPDGGHGDEDEDHHGEEEDDHGRAEGEDEDHHGEEEDDHGEAEDEDHHGEEEEHAHGRYDMHIWLDVNNARVITEETAEQLAQLFPQHEAQLTANVKTTLEKLDLLETELRSLSESFLDSPYVVFHDAYQYLEKMLGLNNVGTVTVNPERSAGAKRLLELRETIRETGATCAFKEPQFNPSILEVLAEGTDLKIGTLDPLGADIEPGPDAYFELLRNMVVSLKDCLADAS